jgi:hypothetical protein
VGVPAFWVRVSARREADRKQSSSFALAAGLARRRDVVAGYRDRRCH